MASSLAACIEKAGDALSGEDKAAVLVAFDAAEADGASASDAARQAVEQQLQAVQDMLAQAEAQLAPKKSAAVTPNKVFTEDAAAAARALLKRKLGQMNTGIDPEVMQAGITLAGYHIEKGARTFTAYAKAMIEDLGDSVRPYLKSWYAAVSFDPRAQEFTADMTPVGELAAINTETIDASMPAPDLAGDSQNANDQEPVVEAGDEGGQPATATRQGGSRSRSGRGRRADDPGVPAGGATAGRESGNQSVRGEDGAAGPQELPTGTDQPERGSDPRGAGVQSDPVSDEAVEDAAGNLPDNLRRHRAQREAESIAVTVGDLANIRETLPYLMPEQQEDVLKAEQRHAKPDGYGMLFTNGTGTGKTFTGLGVIKRLQRQGKGNQLIVVPDAKIMADWVDSAKPMGLTITPLATTKDAGKGIVITTYANLDQNNELVSRDWDHVLADEAHQLMQGKDGEATGALNNLRALTWHPRGWFERYSRTNADDIARSASLSKAIDQLSRIRNLDDTMDAMRAEYARDIAKIETELKPLNAKLAAARKATEEKAETMTGAARPRATFLSATPFAYEKTIDWAEGYLFDYGAEPESQGYNTPSAQQQFFVTHFGYRMKNGKLNKPDAKVDSGLMQRQFNGWLKKSGALAGRTLAVKPDYDRRFVLLDSAVGNQIDSALKWIGDQATAEREANRGKSDPGSLNNTGFSTLSANISGKLYGSDGHLVRRYLLEAIKAKEVVPIIRQHMAMGRKVVVFHDFNKGGSNNPFLLFPATPIDIAPDAKPGDRELQENINRQRASYNAALQQFDTKFPGLTSGTMLSELISPIERFSKEFPNVLLINGTEKKSDVLRRYKEFNDDTNGPAVALVQSAKNKGWSGHDTTGKHQRVLINLGLPTQPTMTIQQEGRIYRLGVQTNAIFRYLNTGTNWERWAFAQTIARRSSEAENLGQGEQARALMDAFVSAFEESDTFEPGHDGEGTGGKDRDALSNAAITEYDRAKSFYWGTAKKNSKTKAQEGTDYFATPEPVGLKLVQWLQLYGGEDAVEPSAGHGAIARWLPDNVNRTAIEPSMVLRSKLALSFDGKIIESNFEELHVVNKFDGIAMNPPFGTAGRTAIDHLAKAATHLRDGGRIAAIIPTGPAADKKFDAWFYEKSQRPVKPLGSIMLDGKNTPIYKGDTVESRASWAPTGVVVGWRDGNPVVRATAPEFRNAGDSMVSAQSVKSVQQTGKRTEEFSPAEGLQLVADIKMPGVTFERAGTGVMTRIVVIEKSPNAAQTMQRDLTGIEDINELFDRLEDMTVPTRAKQAPEAAAAPMREAVQAQREQVRAEAVKKADEDGVELVEYTTKKGNLLKGVIRKDLTQDQAKGIDEYAFKKDGGWFIRVQHLAKLNEKFPPTAVNEPSGTYRTKELRSATNTARFQNLTWDQSSDDMMTAEVGNDWTATIYQMDDGSVEFGILDPNGVDFGKPITYASINEAMLAAPAILARRVTADGIQAGDVREPGSEYDAQAPRRQYQDDRQQDLFNQQIDLFLGSKPDASQAGPGLEEARRAAADAVRVLRADGTILGRALASGLAEKQRTNLVGQVARTPEDLATLAQVYRDPRFETFRVFFTGPRGRIISQVGLTNRLPGVTSAIVGPDLNSYLDELFGTAIKAGATGFYMLHNHPSGNATASTADNAVTRAFAEKRRSVLNPKTGQGLSFGGQVIIDTNEYTVIDVLGNPTKFKKDFGAVEPYTDAGEWANFEITSPSAVMGMVKKLEVDDNAVTLIVLDNQHKVKNITTIPMASVKGSKFQRVAAIRRATLQAAGAKVIAVTRDYNAAMMVAGQSLDVIHISKDGGVTSVREATDKYGEAMPDDRRPRVTADTSPMFDYLRPLTMITGEDGKRKVAQPAYHGTPYRGIEKFSTDKIGTGEGAQAFGWGLYFAGKKEIAEHYRRTLSRVSFNYADDATKQRMSQLTNFDDWIWNHLSDVADAAELDTNKMVSALRAYADRYSQSRSAITEIAKLIEGGKLTPNPAGQLYEVEIPEDGDMLLWDKQLSEQPANVRKALEPFIERHKANQRKVMSAFSEAEVEREIEAGLKTITGQELYEQVGYIEAGGDRSASEYLLGLGVRGIKYLDSTSRTVGDGSFNYVIFSGDDVAITNQVYERDAEYKTEGLTDAEKAVFAKAGLGGNRSVGASIRAGFARLVDAIKDRGSLWNGFRTGALDQFYGIKLAADRTNRELGLGDLTTNQDPYITARLANGATSSVMRAILMHGQPMWASNGQHLEKIPGTKGLLEILQPLGDSTNDFFAWMIGNRAARLMREGRENNFTKDDIKTLQGRAAGKEELFKQVAIEYAGFKKSVLDVAEAAGLIDGDARKAWDHADYIPFYRQVDSSEGMQTTAPTPGRKSLSGQSSGIRVLKGGTAALNDPMENLLLNFSRLIDASLKNNAIGKTIRTVAKAQGVVSKIGYDITMSTVPRQEVRKQLIAAGTPDMIMDVIPEEAFEGMARMLSIVAPKDKDVVRVMVGGKPQFYRVHDPLLLRALTSFVPFDFPGLEIMRFAKRLLTRTITSTPEFMIANWMRDSVASQAITKGFNPMESVTGIVKSYRENGAAEAMLFSGASFKSGMVNAGDHSATAKELRRILRAKGMPAATIDGIVGKVIDSGARGLEHYFELGDAIENANREAVYKATMDRAGSATEAAFESKDLMDFSLRGAWAGYQLLADVLPFFNARVQGMYRLGRSDPKRLAFVGTALMIASLLLAAANNGEDWYEELPDWEKDTYWHMRIAGTHIRIPKPFEIGVVFATLPERTLRYAMNKDGVREFVNILRGGVGKAKLKPGQGSDSGKKLGGRVYANVRDQLAMNLTPQLLAPALGVYMNWDSFRDRQIDSARDERVAAHRRSNEMTSATMRELAQVTAPVTDKIGLSPKDMEFLVNGYLGTVGMYGLALSDMVVRKAAGYADRPEMRLDDYPVLRRFYKEDPARSTVYESDLYKLREQANKIAATIKDLSDPQKGDPAKAKEMQEENKALLAVAPAINTAARTLSMISQQRDRVMRDRDMTPQQKRVRLDELQVKRNEVARNLMAGAYKERIRAAE